MAGRERRMFGARLASRYCCRVYFHTRLGAARNCPALAKQSVDDFSIHGAALGVPVPPSPRFVRCSHEKRLV
eukprot:1356309-Pyramimonas_sp.AAC.1